MNSNDIYVRKDVQDAKEDHILSLIDALDKRIDDMNNRISWMLAISGIILAGVQIGIVFLFWLLQHPAFH